MIVERFYTNLGQRPAKPKSLKTEEVAKAKLTVSNSTSKVVVQLSKDYAKPKTWGAAVRNPGACIRDWLKEAERTDDLVYSFRPIQNEIAKSSWVEQVMIVKTSALKPMLKKSGIDGFFIREFTSATIEAQHKHSIVWLGWEATLQSVLEQCGAIPHALGLAQGRGGLGIRVQPDKYREVGHKLLGDSFSPSDGKVYEFARVPLWASYDEIVTATNTALKGDCTFLRPLPTKKGGKSFLVRAAEPPSQSTVSVEEQVITIQLAKAPSTSQAKVKAFVGKSQAPKWGERPDVEMTGPASAEPALSSETNKKQKVSTLVAVLRRKAGVPSASGVQKKSKMKA